MPLASRGRANDMVKLQPQNVAFLMGSVVHIVYSK